MEITTALATIKAFGELASLIKKSKVSAEVKEKAAELNDSIISLQSTIFSIQSQNHELLDAKREAEEKLVKISNWNNTAQKYRLNEICSGVFLYSLKENHQNTEPFHHICPNCYANQKVSILIKDEMTFSGEKYNCKSQECNASYLDFSNQRQHHEVSMEPPFV